MEMPDLQWYPWKHNLANVKDNVVFLTWKSFYFFWVSPLLPAQIVFAEKPKKKTLIFNSYTRSDNWQSLQGYRCKSRIAIIAWRDPWNNYAYSPFKQQRRHQFSNWTWLTHKPLFLLKLLRNFMWTSIYRVGCPVNKGIFPWSGKKNQLNWKIVCLFFKL